jgi:ribonuclease BN (tRNA processing enzyme)
VTYHTTPVKLAESLSEVGRIVLTHLYPQAAGHEADMAKAVADGTGVRVEVGRDLQTIDI